MGRIKGDTLVNKPLRGRTESKPPSQRRIKRMMARGFKPKPTNGQFIPATLVLKLKKKHQFYETVVHEGAGRDRPAKTSKRKVKQLTAPLSSHDAQRLLLREEAGHGKIKIQKSRVIAHKDGVEI